MLAAILAALQAIPTLVNLINRAVTAYEAHVKAMWSASLQAGLEPLEQGRPTTDAEKAAAAEAVAKAIANLP